MYDKALELSRMVQRADWEHYYSKEGKDLYGIDRNWTKQNI